MKKNTFLFAFCFLSLGVWVVGPTLPQTVKEYVSIPMAYADDDEGESGDDDDSEDGGKNDDNYSESQSVKVEKVKPIYKTILVPVVKITLDPIFTIDSDWDGLFDGIDPHPKMHEREYFTDDDEDGVANAFDVFKGEDDFTYYDQETDINENGIIDSYETMGNN